VAHQRRGALAAAACSTCHFSPYEKLSAATIRAYIIASCFFSSFL
jgi:hypothetical protein